MLNCTNGHIKLSVEKPKPYEEGQGWLGIDSNNMLEPIRSCGGILSTALVDILETTASEYNGDNDETGDDDDDSVFFCEIRIDHRDN